MDFFGKKERRADLPGHNGADTEKGEQHSNIATDTYDSDSTDTNSLEARNEREVQQHPDQVTADAHVGVQKAEAAALVWGRPALLFTYAWSVTIVQVEPSCVCIADQRTGSGS
jgi:hypothetical protein